MLRLIALLLFTSFTIPAQELVLDKLFTRPYVWGTTPSQMTWAKHAHVLAFLWNEKGGAFRGLYIYDADQKRLARLTDLELVKDPINVGDEEQDEHEKNYLLPQLGLNSFDISEDGKRIAFSYKGDLYL